jgi:hypothetical protein
MTTAQLLSMLLRRWYVVLVGIACTGVACAALMLTPRVYGTQMDVVFVAPGGVASSGPDGAFTEPMINFAGIVALKVNGDHPSVRLSSPTAVLYGLGVREGVSVELADSGGQWGSIFNSPVIRIQAVDSSPERVASALDDTVAEIASAATSIQNDSGVKDDQKIGLQTVPDRAQVFAYARTRTGEAKATAAAAALGLSLTACAAALWDRWAGTRRGRSERGRRNATEVSPHSGTPG